MFQELLCVRSLEMKDVNHQPRHIVRKPSGEIPTHHHHQLHHPSNTQETRTGQWTLKPQGYMNDL